jgi:hypothetical protein
MDAVGILAKKHLAMPPVCASLCYSTFGASVSKAVERG